MALLAQESRLLTVRTVHSSSCRCRSASNNGFLVLSHSAYCKWDRGDNTPHSLTDTARGDWVVRPNASPGTLPQQPQECFENALGQLITARLYSRRLCMCVDRRPFKSSSMMWYLMDLSTVANSHPNASTPHIPRRAV